MKYTLLFVDRDGTLTYDNDLYLGSQKNWQEYIQFLPGVVEGLQKIAQWNEQSWHTIFVIIVTNQSGCAFDQNEIHHIPISVLEEVNAYIENMIQSVWGIVHLTLYSPYISSRKAYQYQQKGIGINPRYIQDSQLTKPHTGMYFEALNRLHLHDKNCQSFMIGDRMSDMQFGIHIGSRKNFCIPSNKTEKNIQSTQCEYINSFNIAIDAILDIIQHEI